MNNNTNPISQSVFTESGGLYEQNAVKFTSSEKNIYEVIPVFIYLPPNLLMYKVPDYVVLKVTLVERNKEIIKNG